MRLFLLSLASFMTLWTVFAALCLFLVLGETPDGETLGVGLVLGVFMTFFGVGSGFCWYWFKTSRGIN